MATAHRPLVADLAEVLRGWTWRHTAIGIALGLFNIALGPGGGLLLWPAPTANKQYGSALLFNVLMLGLPFVLAMRLADRAADRGAPAAWAYGLAVVAVAVGGSWLGAMLQLSVWDGRPATQTRSAWVALAIATLYGLGAAAYVQGRRARLSLTRLQRMETERARQMQQLQVQRLQALQARVEPQLLFDTLHRVLDQVPGDPAAADALLADLIALLRALLPGRSVAMSDVQREFALLRSHARVSGGVPPRLVMAADTARSPIAPMLVLPLLRLLQAALGPTQPCAVTAAIDGDRLRLTFGADDGQQAQVPPAAAVDSTALALLRERLASLHGADASLQVTAAPSAVLVLDLPHRPHLPHLDHDRQAKRHDEHHDPRPDR
ncbi:MAG: histidine kinase [Rubrivivax sp.]|nr:histidine kinase [Rubrivivax sp.]